MAHGTAAAAAVVNPLLGLSRDSDANHAGACEVQQSDNTLKHKLHGLGRQIHHLVALFHELEDQFEHEGKVSKVDCQHSSSHNHQHPSSHNHQHHQSSQNCQLSSNHNTEGGLNRANSTNSTWVAKSLTQDWWVQISTIAGATANSVVSSDVEEAGVEIERRDEAFLDAIRDNCSEDVLEQLQKGADPNKIWSSIHIGSKGFVSITPLVAAVLQNDFDIMQLLLEYKASVESQYSFKAGAEQLTWTGSTAHACVASGQFHMLRHLDEQNADLGMLASNGANLTWQAAYFGHANILEFLLDRGVSAECSAVSQDNSELTYSPLHTAAIQGHESIVLSLLEARADILHDDGRGHQPLDDAVRVGHAGIVKELIMSNGDLFGARLSASFLTSSSNTEDRMSCFQSILESQNSVLISEVVQGLGKTPSLLDRLSKEDLLLILKAPGLAPVHVMEAIFRPYQLSFWETRNGHLCRRQPRTAYVDIEHNFNLMVGPHHRLIRKQFENKQVIETEMLEFVTQLVPNEVSPCKKFVPVSTFMCHVPSVHRDLRVLRALADCPDPRIFETEGCLAIINWKWMHEKPLARLRMVIAGVEVANFMAMNFVGDDNAPSWIPKGSEALHVTNVVSLSVWAVAMCLEMSQILGYICTGLARRYFTSGRHWFDLSVMIMTGAVSFGLLNRNAIKDSNFCTVLGVLVFLKWARFLVYLRQIKAIGIQILPITQTMFDIVPFLLVFSLYFLATVNMFYALNTGHGFGVGLLMIYKLVVLGDGDASELENNAGTELTVNLTTGSVLQSDLPPTDYFWVVRGMMVFSSFVIGVSLMNLFLAMLCLSYSLAHDQADRSFVRSLANIVLDQHAVRVGIAQLFCCQQTKDIVYGCSGSDYDVMTTRTPHSFHSSASVMPDTAASSQKAYLWFAKQTSEGKSKKAHA